MAVAEDVPHVESPPLFVRGVDPALDRFFHDDEAPPPRLVVLHYDGTDDERASCLALYELQSLPPVKVDEAWEARVAAAHDPIAREYGVEALKHAAAYLARGQVGETRFVEYGVVGKGERVEYYQRFVARAGKLWHATLFVHATAPAASIDAWLPRLFDAPFGTPRPKERIALFGLATRL